MTDTGRNDTTPGWIWTCMEDACSECQAMAGSVHGSAEAFVPLHGNCQCYAVPQETAPMTTQNLSLPSEEIKLDAGEATMPIPGATGPYTLREDNSSGDLPAGVVMAVRGTAATADAITANKRRYPAPLFHKAVRQFNSRSDKDEMIGELDHPDWQPQLKNAAMRITALGMKGNDLTFGAHVLDIPHGRTLAAMLKAGVNVNVSTRGSGSMMPCCEEHGKIGEPHANTKGAHHPHSVICDDYELHGIDAVSRGASPSAYIHREGEIMDLITEQSPGTVPPPGSPNVTQQVADLQSALEQARADAQAQRELAGQHQTALEATRSDLEVLQAAMTAERANLQATLQKLEADLAVEKSAHATESQAAQRIVADAIAQRDDATGALSRQAVAEQVHALTAMLRPDVRKTVAEQLAQCATPAEVKERWESIQHLLQGAGISAEPAGQGRPDNSEAVRGATPYQLTPEQRLQQRLLGIN